MATFSRLPLLPPPPEPSSPRITCSVMRFSAPPRPTSGTLSASCKKYFHHNRRCAAAAHPPFSLAENLRSALRKKRGNMRNSLFGCAVICRPAEWMRKKCGILRNGDALPRARPRGIIIYIPLMEGAFRRPSLLHLRVGRLPPRGVPLRRPSRSMGLDKIAIYESSAPGC